MKKLFLIKNPELFQGERYINTNRNYFEGWYFKNTNKNNGISFIPGINLNGEEKNAFIQVITNDFSCFVNYNIDEIIVKELDVLGNFRYANLYPTVINAVSQGNLPVKDMITDYYKFDQAEDALENSIVHKADTVKMVIEF